MASPWATADNQDFDRLFFSAEYPSIQIDCMIERTVHLPFMGAFDLSNEVVDAARLDEWKAIQQELRSQSYRQIISTRNGVWKRRVIAGEGDLFVTNMDYELEMDFVQLTKSVISYEYGEFKGEDGEPHDVLTSPLDLDNRRLYLNRGLAGLSISELLGEYRNFPVALNRRLEMDEYTMDQSQGMVIYRFQTPERLHSIVEKDMATGDVKRVVYLESNTPLATRELIYGNWAVDDSSRIRRPDEITLRRYIGAGIDERGDDYLSETIIVNITRMVQDW